MTDLGTLGGSDSDVYDINNRGQVTVAEDQEPRLQPGARPARALLPSATALREPSCPAGDGYSPSQVQTLRLQRMQRTDHVRDCVGPDERAAFGQLKAARRSELSRHTVPQPTTTPATTHIESPVMTKTAKGSSNLIGVRCWLTVSGRDHEQHQCRSRSPTFYEASRAERLRGWGIPRSPLGVFPPIPTLRPHRPAVWRRGRATRGPRPAGRLAAAIAPIEIPPEHRDRGVEGLAPHRECASPSERGAPLRSRHRDTYAPTPAPHRPPPSNVNLAAPRLVRRRREVRSL